MQESRLIFSGLLIIFVAIALYHRMDKLKMEKNPPKVIRFPSPEALTHSLIQYIAEASEKAIEERGVFVVAISGGSLPALLGGKNGELIKNEDIEFSKWKIFLADERAVPDEDAESNKKGIKEAFLNELIKAKRFDEKNMFGYPQHAKNVEQAAFLYEEMFLKNGNGRFDLILLGIGPDGHTASLFPNHKLLKEEKRMVAAILDSPKPPPQRITFTYPVINAARAVVFVCSGASKAEIVNKAAIPLEEIKDWENSYPCARVRPIDGTLSWFCAL